MPPTRTHDATAIKTVLSPAEARKLRSDAKQFKYHENAKRYLDKKRDIRGEYGSTRPPVRVRLTEEETEIGRPPQLQLVDVELFRVLGKGAFGSVGVVRTKRRQPKHTCDVTGTQLAVKMFNKRVLRREEQDLKELAKSKAEDFVNLERKNLASVEWSPFISGLFACLQDSKNLYMLMELGHCGSLAKVIKDSGALPASVCRFYFANLVAAVEHIHHLGLVHCDIKPDNIIVGPDGYLMLADFGVGSFEHERRDWNMVGTIMYSPPESLREQIIPEIVKSIDWWSLACVLFEMASGRMAFPYLKMNSHGGNTDKRGDEIRRRIMTAKYFWPRGVEIDATLKDLCDRMLHKDFAKRLGCIVIPPEDGSKLRNDEIRRHPFMLNFPWHALCDRKLVAPSVPSRVPDLREQWHMRPLPRQWEIPGLPRDRPLPHNQWDDRFTTTKEKIRQQREEERKRAAQHAGHTPGTVRIAAWNQRVAVRTGADEVDDPKNEGSALRRAKAKVMEMNAAFAAQVAAACEPAPSSPSADQTVPGQQAQMTTDTPRPFVLSPAKFIFDLPGREIPSPKQITPPRAGPKGPAPIFRPVVNGTLGADDRGAQQSSPIGPGRLERFVDSPDKFELPIRVSKPEPQFKEPYIPVKVIENELEKLQAESGGPSGSRHASSSNALSLSGVTVRRRRD